MRLKSTTRFILMTAVLLGVPRLALACPVCFGQNDSPMSNAMNSGILFMLGVVVAMLAGFGSFVFYLSRRAHSAAETERSMSPGSADAGRFVRTNPQEGIAQC